MGKIHKRFNWKSRQIVETVIDESEQNKIQVDLGNDSGNYGGSNALVLPSTKRKTKRVKDRKGPPTKLLSKKQRKKLLKIAERKLKKIQREDLVKALNKVQAKPKQMAVLTSLQSTQTLGRKKYLSPSFLCAPTEAENDIGGKNMSNHLKWKTPKAAKRELKQKQAPPAKRVRDLTVVQSESSEDEDSENDIEDNSEENLNVIEDSECNEEKNNEDNERMSDKNGEEGRKRIVGMEISEDKGSDEKKMKNEIENGNEKVIKNKKKDKENATDVNGEDNTISNKEKRKKIETEGTTNENEETNTKKLKKKKSQKDVIEICDDDNTKRKKKKNKKGKKLQTEVITNGNEETVNTEEKQEETGEPDIIECTPKSVPESKDKKAFKSVDRDPEVQKMRLKLPILSEEHTVMEAINDNLITIVVGQTGSGKTTQVPQFLYEAGYTSDGKMIGVTEPRRVAARTMSERVGFEMNLPPSKVSYQVRYEGNATPETEIKFMTDGVLFRELREDNFLQKYSAIIIDEAHERSVHSDILIGLLSKIVPKRKRRGNPLKLIIMSATLRIEDFTENPHLFGKLKPPVVKIQPRMFDVTIHFNKTTDDDYVEAAFRKICKIHRQLPDGGILVFLTGQQEITDLCQHVKQTFPFKKRGEKEEEEIMMSNYQQRMMDRRENRKSHKKKKMVDLPQVNLKSFTPRGLSSTNGDDEGSNSDEEEGFTGGDISAEFLAGSEQPLWVLPLYSLLPRHKQKMVFDPPPDGTRLCVISTNVAETSLTIPNVKYVVDGGRTKEKLYDPVTGVSSYNICWTSQASANQRAGRAGRTSNGFCYRLYSSAIFNDEFEQHAIPDMRKRPLDDVVLTMKAIGVSVLKFPFPTPPDPGHLQQSFKRLVTLGALAENKDLLAKKKGDDDLFDATEITEVGQSMSALPLSPRFAKMVLYCQQHEGILDYVVLVIASLTVREVLIEVPLGGKGLTEDQQRWSCQRLKWAGTGPSHLLGDLLVLMRAVLEAEKNDASYEWCHRSGVRHGALMEVRKLRRQLTNEILSLMPDVNLSLRPGMEPPSHKQACIIAEVVFMGSLDQVARKVEQSELATMEDKQKWKGGYRTVHSSNPVFLSSASALCKDRPKYVMYQDIYESTKVYLRGITVIDEAWLCYHGGDLVELSPPLDVPPPRFDPRKDQVVCTRSGTYGPFKWPLREYELPFPPCRDLFKWVSHAFLKGVIWPPLQPYAQHLYDLDTLISPISFRYREKRENLIRAFLSKNVTSSKALEEAWKMEPQFLKAEYFAWFENEDKFATLNSKWPPLKEEDRWTIS